MVLVYPYLWSEKAAPSPQAPSTPGDPVSYDRYAYSRNNPVRYTDPSGHWYYDPGCDCLVDHRSPEFEHRSNLNYVNTAKGMDYSRSRESFVNKALPFQKSQDLGPFCQARGDTYFAPGSPAGLEFDHWEYIFHPEKVDWVDVGIGVFGIVGDFAKVTGVGVPVWVSSEIVEGIGVAKDTYDLVNGDATGAATSGGKAISNLLGLEPTIYGFLGNIITIGLALSQGLESYAVYHQKEVPKYMPSP
jgi:hypothetical protein